MAALIMIIILLTALAVFFTVEFYNLIFRGFAPFISSRPQVIKTILEELRMDENAVVYELGCGVAGFLRAIEERHPRVKLIGVEYGFLAYVIANIQTSLCKSKIELVRQNLFLTDLKGADIIYCYLNDTMMQKLAGKFRQECKPGTQIISYMFSIPGIEPERIVKVKGRKEDKIYFCKI